MYARGLARDVNETVSSVSVVLHCMCTLCTTKQFLLSVLSYIVCVRLRAFVSVVCRSRDFITIVPSVTHRMCTNNSESSSKKRLKVCVFVVLSGVLITGKKIYVTFKKIDWFDWVWFAY